MTCDIVKRQNSPQALKLVRAFRQGYASVKSVGTVQLALAVVAVVLGFAADRWAPEHWLPQAKAVVALCGIAFSLFDVAFLEPAAKSKQQAAALIQEQFDELVFQLPWTKTTRPDGEEVSALAKAYAKRHGDPDKSIEHWYPAVVDALPIEQARLICQRSNMWWDAALRRRVAKLYLAGVLLLAVGALGWAMFKKLEMVQFIPIFAASLLPAGLQFVRKFRAHESAAVESENAKKRVEQIWETAARGTLTPEELGRGALALQEEIYQRRRTAPPVPDLIYDSEKTAYEEQMKEAAETLVSQAQRATSVSPQISALRALPEPPVDAVPVDSPDDRVPAERLNR